MRHIYQVSHETSTPRVCLAGLPYHEGTLTKEHIDLVNYRPGLAVPVGVTCTERYGQSEWAMQGLLR